MTVTQQSNLNSNQNGHQKMCSELTTSTPFMCSLLGKQQSLQSKMLVAPFELRAI